MTVGGRWRALVPKGDGEHSKRVIVESPAGQPRARSLGGGDVTLALSSQRVRRVSRNEILWIAHAIGDAAPLSDIPEAEADGCGRGGDSKVQASKSRS